MKMIDQRQLPLQFVIAVYHRLPRDVATAIRDMVVHAVPRP